MNMQEVDKKFSDAHSSYITYVFGTSLRTFKVSEGSRRTTYVLGRMQDCILAVHESEGVDLLRDKYLGYIKVMREAQ